MEMKIDEAITRYKNNAEYERTHGNLQGCLEFRQLAEWLEKYQKIEQLIAMDDENHRRTIKLCELKEVLDGNDD